MKLWILLAFLAQAEGSSDTILKPGPGRDIVTAACTQCHTAEIIVASHMSRKTWDTTLTWMQETQGLVELEPDIRALILDYLVLTQGFDDEADNRSSPWANPLYRPNPIW
jgi:hypothetical protein